MDIRVEFINPVSYIEAGEVRTPSATIDIRDLPSVNPMGLSKEDLEKWIWRNLAALHTVMTSCDITYNKTENILWKVNAGYREIIKEVMESYMSEVDSGVEEVESSADEDLTCLDEGDE